MNPIIDVSSPARPNADENNRSFSDWIDSTRDAHPELARRLDLAQTHANELASIKSRLLEVEQQRDAAIASVRGYFQAHQELIKPLTQMAEDYAESGEDEIAWLCYEEVMVDEIVARAQDIIEIDKRLGYMGKTSHDNLALMETGEESFAIWIEFNDVKSRDLFDYRDGAVILKEMNFQDIEKLKQLHAEAIAWEENFPAWKAKLDANI